MQTIRCVCGVWWWWWWGGGAREGFIGKSDGEERSEMDGGQGVSTDFSLFFRRSVANVPSRSRLIGVTQAGEQKIVVMALH